MARYQGRRMAGTRSATINTGLDRESCNTNTGKSCRRGEEMTQGIKDKVVVKNWS
jgi:hypothetical protein